MPVPNPVVDAAAAKDQVEYLRLKRGMKTLLLALADQSVYARDGRLLIPRLARKLKITIKATTAKLESARAALNNA